ncbi:MAG: ribosome maturation factor RimP [Deltaproteobacteria bacterium]|jgi:ribosome maturation factor RimP|nr:ribosome maturation factor RimP [Deltaproteobacteria bacterium]MBW2202585.1 ribosome maturation factor RimP [Deltaproteobacteria bacterium]
MSEMTSPIIREVCALIEPILDEIEIELVDIEYLFEQGRWILRIYVDKSGGITLGHCTRVSREIDDLIEVKDIFHQGYVLEVSSPGLNRRLKKEKDFQRAVGKDMKIRMATPLEGQRNFRGNLQSFKDGILCLSVKDDLILLSYGDVEKANLVYDFGD